MSPRTLVLAVVLALPVAARAQGSASSRAPNVMTVSVGVRPVVLARTPAPVPAPAPMSGLTPTNKMIFGGVGFLAGVFVGGDVGTVLKVGGVGVGLYGLYQYLQ